MPTVHEIRIGVTMQALMKTAPDLVEPDELYAMSVAVVNDLFPNDPTNNFTV